MKLASAALPPTLGVKLCPVKAETWLLTLAVLLPRVNEMAWAGMGARAIAARLVTTRKPLATELFRNFSGG
ncbi:MAG: hypothetical protein ACOYN8_06905 [Pseudanabaena sp.]